MNERLQKKIAIRRRVEKEHNLDGILAEMEGLRRISHDASEIIEAIDQDFSKLTGLNKVDYTFLFFATALQTVRWVLQENLAQEQSERKKHDDASIKKQEKSEANDFNNSHSGKDVTKGKYKDWKEIIDPRNGVPYDINVGSTEALGQGMNGKDHRLRTLGHDPYLGWIFGTANIMTDTCTTTYEGSWNIVKDALTGRRRFGSATTIDQIFSDAYFSTQEDKLRLAAAVAKQGMHIESDMYTKMGLPIPGLTVIWPSMAKRIYAGGYDYVDLKCDLNYLGVIAKQAAYASLINFIIAVIHDFFYNENEYPNHDLYEVKTRKILLYSNLIASSSNLIYVAITSAMGNADAWKKIDFGGLAVTIYRLFTDFDFIYNVKREFIKEGYLKKVSEATSIPVSELEIITPDDFKRINDVINQ